MCRAQRAGAGLWRGLGVPGLAPAPWPLGTLTLAHPALPGRAGHGARGAEQLQQPPCPSQVFPSPRGNRRSVQMEKVFPSSSWGSHQAEVGSVSALGSHISCTHISFQCPCCMCSSLGKQRHGEKPPVCPVSPSVSLHIPCPTSGHGWHHGGDTSQRMTHSHAPRAGSVLPPKRGCPFLLPHHRPAQLGTAPWQCHLCCCDPWRATETLSKHLECCTCLCWISRLPAVQPARLELGNAEIRSLRR